MWSAASVLVCALNVLGRSQASMPPIELIESAPPGVSAGAEAFVLRSTLTIYLITSSAVFRDAAGTRRTCTESPAMKKLASILAHEEWHILHGPDEKAAYERQLITLITLGIDPGSGLYRDVHNSMRAVLKARKRAAPQLLVARRE
jgi:hypothetical protein